MEETTITIPLESAPQAKQSVRFGKGRAYTSKVKAAYDLQLRLRIREQYKGELLESNAFLSIFFYFKKPKKLTKLNSKQINGVFYKTTTPDCDNLLKPVFDALTKAGVLIDDKIIHYCVVTKIWGKSNSITIKIDGE